MSGCEGRTTHRPARPLLRLPGTWPVPLQLLGLPVSVQVTDQQSPTSLKTTRQTIQAPGIMMQMQDLPMHQLQPATACLLWVGAHQMG